MTRSLCDSLARNARSGRTIGIKVRLDDWTTITRAHTIAAPTCEYETVVAVAQRLLQENAPQRPVRLLGVRVAGLTHGEQAAESAGTTAGHEGAPRPDAGPGATGDEGEARAQMALPL